MRQSVLLFVYCWWVFAVGACVPVTRGRTAGVVPQQPARATGVRFDAFIGQWQVRGVIDRVETAGGAYDYVTRSNVTCYDDGNLAGADGLNLRGVTLRASVFDAAVSPQNRRVLYAERRSINVRFAAGDRTKTLPEVRFRLPRQIETQADQITLEFDGPRVVVPTVLNLKGRYWR